ncbi:MAG: TSUP family transporter [Verrucomicrobiaceae bacterium]|nr:TSUP family transporter [Verrucomicrobiaceae bacterium]
MSAGFIDSIAGGGGLISVPALLWAGLTPQMALGTNQQSTWGTLMAVRKYTRAGFIDWPQMRLPIVVTLLLCQPGHMDGHPVEQCRAEAHRAMDAARHRPLRAAQSRPGKDRIAGADEPGRLRLCRRLRAGILRWFLWSRTGAFPALACISLLGLELTRATAFTKVVNLASNAAS